jgi:malate dehydrogenase (oxaloacetate-decarboxylating)(NADP+)
MCDTKGTIRTDRTDLNEFKRRHAVETTAQTLKEALVGADVFVGVSAANVLTGDDVKKMGDFPAIFAMANPDPEIAPAEVAKALEGRKYVMVTGRSDYPNQINNVLGFPYLFRGALDVRATTINKEMKVAAANALAMLARQDVPESVASIYPDENLQFGTGYIIPKPFDSRLFVEVSFAVAKAAIETGVARDNVNLEEYRRDLELRNKKRFE